MKTFQIFGDILTNNLERRTADDVCPSDVQKFLNTLKENEPCQFDISSCGGSVLGCLSIVGMMMTARKMGHNITCHIIGIAASSASVIACAGDKLIIDSNSVMMIHLPYSCDITGNKNELIKEAHTLEQMEKSLVNIYKSKFGISEEEISKLLEDETWILADQIDDYKIDCEINSVEDDNEKKMKYAAMLKRFNNLTYNIKANFNMKEEETKEIEKTTVEETVASEPSNEEIKEEVKEEVKEEIVEEIKEQEEKVEEPVEISPEQVIEELKKEIEVLKTELDSCKKALAECGECKPDEDVEKRVSGMQSKMQMKINDITKEFQDKLELKDKELSDCKNQISDLAMRLETASKEFSTMKSALEEKENALATLNAGVNSNPIEKTDYKKLHGQDFFNWVKENNIR